MALFRRFNYRKPPDMLLEISDRVYVFDCCFSSNTMDEDEYKTYIAGIAVQLQEHYPDAAFMVFNFREGDQRSQISDILSRYGMRVTDYPRQYEGCQLLPLEMIHFFLRSTERWLSNEGQKNVLLMHCERGGWPVLAFMLAALLLHREQYSSEQKTLEMVYKQAPRELHLSSPLNPRPSQHRYLRYISGRKVDSDFPPSDTPFALDCIIFRGLPLFNGGRGCRPVVRVYSQDPASTIPNRESKLLFSTSNTKEHVCFYRQEECALVKMDIHCCVKGDVVLECVHLEDDLVREVMMFRVMFHTTFIQSNVLMLTHDDVDVQWDAKDHFPREFKAKVLFSNADVDPSIITAEAPDEDETETETETETEEFFEAEEIFCNGADAEDEMDSLGNREESKSVISRDSGMSNECENKQDREDTHKQKKVELQRSQQKNGDSIKQKKQVVSNSQPATDGFGLKNKSKWVESQCTPSRVAKPNAVLRWVPPNKGSYSNSLHVTYPPSGYYSAPREIPSTKDSRSRSKSKSPSPRASAKAMAPADAGRAPRKNSSCPALLDMLKVQEAFLNTSSSRASPENQTMQLPSPPGRPLTPPLPPCLRTSRRVPQIQGARTNLPASAVLALSSQESPIIKAPVTHQSPPPPPPPPPSTVLYVGQLLPPPPSSLPFSNVDYVASSVPLSGSLPSFPEPLLPTVYADTVSKRARLGAITPPQSPPVPPTHGAPYLPPLSPSPPPPPPAPRPPLLSTSAPPLPPPPSLPSPPSKNAPPTPPPPPPPPPQPPLYNTPPAPPPPSPPCPPAPHLHGSASQPPPPLPEAPPPPPPPPLRGPLVPPPPPTGGPPPPPPSVCGAPPPPPPPGGHIRGPPPPPSIGGHAPCPPLPPGAPRPPGSGPPPPPPGALGRGLPVARGQGLSRTAVSLAPRRSTLKPLHWSKVTRALGGSLWEELQRHGETHIVPEFDVSEIETLFSATVPKKDGASGKSRGEKSIGSKPERVQLIDLRRANNTEIMLTKVKMPLPDMMAAVLAMDESILDADQVENLMKFCPTKDEMDLLKGYTGDKELLGKCEQFFLELMKVPRVESKLRAFVFKIQFNSQISDFKKSLNTVNSACEEVRDSLKLKDIMKKILYLGNTLNQGTARGSAVGFKLDSLSKLTDTRATNNRMTLMHYLCKVLASKSPALLDFHENLPSVEAASKIQLKSLAEEMQAIINGLEKVKQELEASEADGPVSEMFCKTLKEFIGVAEPEAASVKELYSLAGKNADALALYFGEDPARCPFEQVAATLLNFVRLFRKAHQENLKQGN